MKSYGENHRKFRPKRRTANSIAECNHRVIKPPGARRWYFVKGGNPCTFCPKCPEMNGNSEPSRKQQVLRPQTSW